VKVDEKHTGILVEGLLDAVSVVRIEIDISDLAARVAAPGIANGNDNVVDIAEAFGIAGHGVVKTAERVEPHLSAAAQDLHGGAMRSPARTQGPFVDPFDNGSVLSPQAAGEHFEAHLAPAGFAKKVKILGVVMQGEKAGIKRLGVHHLHPGVGEHTVAIAEIKGFCGSFRLERVVRTELKAAHLIGIHKKGWGSVKGWRHGFRQRVGMGLGRILTEAEKKGQLNSGIP